MNLSKREIKAGNITFAFFLFKNLPSNDIEELIEWMFGQTNVDQSVIINSIVWGHSSFMKNWLKGFDDAFDEANWPFLWVDRVDAKMEISGYFITISGTTIKTIVSDDFVTKNFDSPFGRVMTGGNFNAGKGLSVNLQANKLTDNFQKALLFSGMASENIIETTLLIPTDSGEVSFGIPLSSVLVSPENKNIQANILAISVLNDKSVTFLANDLIHLTEFNVNNHSLTQVILKYSISGDENIGTISQNLLSELEKHLLQKSIEWKNLLYAIIYCSNSEISKILISQIKEKKIPLSAIIIIDHQIAGFKNGFVMHMSFIK